MKTSNRVFLTAALFALATGVAYADGDGGDNSMNPFTGESYAAFYGGNVGDFVTARERQATALTPAEEPATHEMVATLDRRGHPQNPFRDDTAA
jgi:hypothetical protein